MKRFFSFFPLLFLFGGIVFFSGCGLFKKETREPSLPDASNQVKEESSESNTTTSSTEASENILPEVPENIEKVPSDSQSGKTEDEATPPTSDSPKEDVKEDVLELTLIAKRWEFDPSVITVKKGKMVRLNISNLDVPHGFQISAFSVNEFLAPGQIKVVEFTPDKVGTFDFFCSIYCGDGHSGMKGTLVVEE